MRFFKHDEERNIIDIVCQLGSSAFLRFQSPTWVKYFSHTSVI